uniref:Reverse transcriptase Ty1/copia-type domain-containing protein n=1 Tax=Solanum lycopersicum TaxID=4081 RepID=A0A3Q7GWR4_SOLLC
MVRQCQLITKEHAILQDFYTGKVKGIGKEEGGLYLLQSKCSEKICSRTSSISLAEKVTDDVQTWHKRLGNIPAGVMKKFSFLQNKIDVSFSEHIFPFLQLKHGDNIRLFPELEGTSDDCYSSAVASEVVHFPDEHVFASNSPLQESLVPVKTTDDSLPPSQHDHSLFILRRRGKQVMILVYVDDLLITGDDEGLIQETKDVLHKAFKIKDLGSLKYFLGIEVCRSKKGILLCQRKYALKLIDDLGLAGSKTAMTPLEQNQKLTSQEHCGLQNDALLSDIKGYQRLIGKLLYLTLTRPDIAYSVQTLSQFMQNPKRSHLEATHRVVRSIKNEPGMGILLSAEGSASLIAYCDVDWASCPNSRKSVTGYIVKLCNP